MPPHAWFLVSAVFHYLGPSFAVLLFASIAPSGVAWLRIASAGLVFSLWRRPWRGFAALQGLDLRGTRVSDVTPLAGLTALQSLDLWGAPVIDVTPLRHIRGLKISRDPARGRSGDRPPRRK